jgi:streptogramin lyase
MARALGALALAVFALGQTVTSSAAFTAPKADPTSGAGSLRAISLGPKTVTTWCLAAAADGSVWTLGNGYPVKGGAPVSRLSQVKPDGSVQQFAIPPTLISERPQCLAVDMGGNVWFAAGSSIIRFDPAGRTTRTFNPPGDDG